MTKKQYEDLAIYENLFNSAINSGYIRTVGASHASYLHGVFKELFGRDSGILGGCGRCVLRDVKRIGEEYFKYKNKEEMEEKLKALNEELNPTTTDGTTITTATVEDNKNEIIQPLGGTTETTIVVEEPKKKGGRKKKNNDQN